MTWAIKHKGFSLIEVMVALLVMAIGLLGVAKLVTLLQASHVLTQQRAEAVQLAQNDLETFKGYVYTTSEPGEVDYPQILPGLSLRSVNNTTYFVLRVVVPQSSDQYRLVSTYVYWLGRDLQFYSVVLSTIIYKREPLNVGNFTVSGSAGTIQP